MRKKDDTPEGGWLGPPPMTGLKALATTVGSKKGKWIWKKNKLTAKELKDHKKFQKAMKKADAKGKWSFSWK